MAVTEPRQAEAPGLARSRKPRPGNELLVEYVFRPLAHVVVLVLLPLRVPPPAVVLANAAAGLLAAAAIWQDELLAGALLLQLKTLLDNADGQLARASGRTSRLGRYLDTLSDFVVNAAVFAALGAVTGRWWLALASFAALTLVLSVDFNTEALYRRARGEAGASPEKERGAGRVEAALAAVYDVVFTPQDRIVRRFSESRLARVAGATDDAELRRRATLAYYDDRTTTVLANFGLSTQLAVLGVLLVAGVPGAYLWVPIGCLVALPLLQARRERRAREVLRAP